MWDAGQLPVLWVYGEFGATQEHPYHDRFYTLALQPISRNPYPPQHHHRIGEKCLTTSTTRPTNGWISATAVVGILHEHPGLTGDAATAARLVRQEVLHLNRLVEDLIEISRFDAGTY
jgi:hypothetical protein